MVPAGVSESDVLEWYARHMPCGADFRELAATPLKWSPPSVITGRLLSLNSLWPGTGYQLQYRFVNLWESCWWSRDANFSSEPLP